MGTKINSINLAQSFDVALRKYACRRPWFHRPLSRIHLFAMAGPWRPWIAKYYQRFSKNKPLAVNETPFFSDFDVDLAVESIEIRGFSTGVRLSEKYVDALVKDYEQTKNRITYDPHKANKMVRDIAHNKKVVEVARRYLGVEPVFHSSCLFRTPPLPGGIGLLTATGDFHYDATDYKSVALFIYLTDTDQDCGPHVVIENTHKTKTLSHLRDRLLAADAAQRKYGDRIRTITGTRGTAFFVDLLSFHKQSKYTKPRLMLSLEYVLRRSPRL